MTLTLEEAIGILQALVDEPDALNKGAETSAVKLGIEALRRVKTYREAIGDTFLLLLRGETKE